MGRNKLPILERKETFTLRIKKEYKEEIKKFENYNSIIENLILQFLKNNKLQKK